MHGYGTKISLYDIFTEIEDDMEMSKSVTSKNDIIAVDGCEYSSVKFIECDVTLNFIEAEFMDGYLLIGFEFSSHCDAGDRVGDGGNNVLREQMMIEPRCL